MERKREIESDASRRWIDEILKREREREMKTEEGLKALTVS